MTITVFIDGQSVPPESASVSVFDRGLLFGDSVFETLGTHGGRLFALDEHVRRLRRSLGLVFIELEVSDQCLCEEIESAVRLSGNPESYVRVIVTRGSGELGLDPALARAPTRIIIVTPLKRPSASSYSDGVTAISYRTQRTAEATEAVGAKVGNYLVAVLAMRQARPVGANEALIVDGDGRVLEGATSNVFVYRQGRLITPPESAGILAGITRSVVLRLAEAEGLVIEQACPTLAEVFSADELFITSSIREMLALVRVDDHVIASGRPGPVYQALWRRFQADVH